MPEDGDLRELRARMRREAQRDTNDFYLAYTPIALRHPAAGERLAESGRANRPLNAGILGASLLVGGLMGRLQPSRARALGVGGVSALASVWTGLSLAADTYWQRNEGDLLWMIEQQDDMAATLLRMRPKYPLASQWQKIDARMAELGVTAADVLGAHGGGEAREAAAADTSK